MVAGTTGLLTSLTLYINQEGCLGMRTRCLAVNVGGTAGARPSRSDLLGGLCKRAEDLYRPTTPSTGWQGNVKARVTS